MYNLIKYIVLIYVFSLNNNGYCTSDLPYSAAESFATESLTFHRIRSAQQDIESYKAICEDSGFRNSWFVGLPPYGLEDPETEPTPELVHASDIKYFQKREEKGFYKLTISFSDYNVYDAQTQELVGRFILNNERVNQGRIEKGIYILKKFRKKGFSVEILFTILSQVIKPALGKPFTIGSYEDSSGKCEQEHYNNFQGVFSKISPWYNYPSIASSHKAGCVLRWENLTPLTFYPAGDEAHIDLSAETSFKAVIKDFSHLNAILLAALSETESTEMTPPPHIFPKVAFEFLENFPQVKNRVIQNLYQLLNTDEIHTLASTIDALISLGKTSDHLKSKISREKAMRLLDASNDWRSPFRKYKSLLETLSKE